MAKYAHKNDTLPYPKLDFKEQALSINAEINNLYAAILHHVDHSPRRQQTRRKVVNQVQRLLNRVNRIP